jgi:hypothetical protein
MALKKLAAAAVMLAIAAPTLAFDGAGEAGASTMFYISIPLDFQLPRKERQQWTAGLQLQGKRDYQAVRIDSRMLNYFSFNDIDAKWMIAGLVATGAAVAIGSKDKRTTDNLQQQQTQSQQTQQQTGGSSGGTCTRPVTDPCRR